MFVIRKILPGTSFEVLLKNRLDIEVHKIAQSFNFVLNLLLASKYSVRDSHIYPRDKTYQLFAFSCAVLVNSLCIYRTYSVDITDIYMKNLESKLLQLFAVFYFITYLIGFTTMFILDLVHKNNYVLLIMMIQTVHRSIDFSRSIRSFISWNWITTISIIFINIFISAVYYSSAYYDYVIDIVCDYIADIMFTTLDINLVIATRIITLLKKYLGEWIQEIHKMNDVHENYEQCIKMFGKYKNIMKVYELHKKIFQVLVSSLQFGKIPRFRKPTKIKKCFLIAQFMFKIWLV